MRVIDSSALVKYFSREEHWEIVRKYMLEGVITIDLAIKELSNALWKKVLRGELFPETARTILQDLVGDNIFKIVSQSKYLVKAFDIAIKYGVTIYDVLFIAVALDENMGLITSDQKQKEVAEKLGVKTIYIP